MENKLSSCFPAKLSILIGGFRFAEEAPEILKHLVSIWLLTLLTLFNNSHADDAEGEILSMDDPVKRNTILRRHLTAEKKKHNLQNERPDFSTFL